jgi:hypothetical protein
MFVILTIPSSSSLCNNIILLVQCYRVFSGREQRFVLLHPLVSRHPRLCGISPAENHPKQAVRANDLFSLFKQGVRDCEVCLREQIQGMRLCRVSGILPF